MSTAPEYPHAQNPNTAMINGVIVRTLPGEVFPKICSYSAKRLLLELRGCSVGI
jgi:hypothetical protein